MQHLREPGIAGRGKDWRNGARDDARAGNAGRAEHERGPDPERRARPLAGGDHEPQDQQRGRDRGRTDHVGRDSSRFICVADRPFFGPGYVARVMTFRRMRGPRQSIVFRELLYFRARPINFKREPKHDFSGQAVCSLRRADVALATATDAVHLLVHNRIVAARRASIGIGAARGSIRPRQRNMVRRLR